MNTAISNIEMHEIGAEIDKISALIELLDPEDTLELIKCDEILDHYLNLLSASVKKARVCDSNLKLVV